MNDPFEELSKALKEFIDVIAKEFKIYNFLNWFEKKLKGVIHK